MSGTISVMSSRNGVDCIVNVPCEKRVTSHACRGDDSSSETTTTDQPESAFLLVRRSLSEKMPKIGTPVTITVEIFNSGER